MAQIYAPVDSREGLTPRTTQPVLASSSTALAELGDYLYEEDGRIFIYTLAGEGLSKGNILALRADEFSIAGMEIPSIPTIVHGRSYDKYYPQYPNGSYTGDPENKFLGFHALTISRFGNGQHVIIDQSDVDSEQLGCKTPMSNPAYDIMGFHPNKAYKACSGSDRKNYGVVIGVAPCDVTSGYYFWRQVSGPAPVLMKYSGGEGYVSAGRLVYPSNLYSEAGYGYIGFDGLGIASIGCMILGTGEQNKMALVKLSGIL